MVGIFALQVVDMQGHGSMVDEAVEELAKQVDIEVADAGARIFDTILKSRPPGKVYDDARQGFIERHIAVTVAAYAFFVADGLGKCLTQGDADVFHRVVGIDMQIALGDDIQIDQTMARHLIKHVLKKRHASIETRFTAAIQIDLHRNLGFQCITANFSLAHIAHGSKDPQTRRRKSHDTIPLPSLDYSGAARRPDDTMSQYWSALVSSLTPYVPGEQPKIANLTKLNTNENPYPPSPRVLAAMEAELANGGAALRLYPDPNADRLKVAIANYHAAHGITPRHVFVGNGSDEVLAHAFQALLKHEQPLLFPDISYSFYPVYCGLYDIDSVTIPLADDFSIRVEDYARPCGGIVFANPNAPTGRLLALPEIEKLLISQPNAVVLVDEAYVDFGGESAISLVQRYPNLLVAQTLSKSRSLAGLRVGFAIGHPDLIEALERVKNSFNSYPLDRLAIVGAEASFADEEYFQASCGKVIASREKLIAGLQGLGFEVIPSAANFVFARHLERDAAQIAAGLRERGVIVRHFKLPRIDQYLRISVGTDGECGVLLGALAQILV